jgi:hypothetical protein
MNAPCDLLGMPLPVVRKNTKPEAGALREVLQALNAHPDVAWVERMNSGAAKIGNRFVRFGWKGCPDVLGQLIKQEVCNDDRKAKNKAGPVEGWRIWQPEGTHPRHWQGSLSDARY